MQPMHACGPLLPIGSGSRDLEMVDTASTFTKMSRHTRTFC